MSKKLFSSGKWKRHIARRQRSQLHARQRNRSTVVAKRARAIGRPRKPVELRLEAPENFSITQNPHEMSAFIADFRRMLDQRPIYLDLRGVTTITPDAIVTLVALVKGDRATRVRGNFPERQESSTLLIESGFFDHVKTGAPVPRSFKGRIEKRHSTRVEPETASGLIRFGLEAAGLEPGAHQACYRGLIECMSNTHNHASGRSARSPEQWWAMVLGNRATGRVQIAFADTGIGIFGSIKLRGLKKVYRAIGAVANSKILHDVLEGRVESSTGYPYRGKGLPMVYRDSLNKRIRSLYIIANDVFADVERGDYVTLRPGFTGTIVCWEV